MRPKDIEKEKLVLHTAMELVVLDGVQGFSMSKLAKACRLSVGTLYVYYKDKEELIAAVGEAVSLKFFQAVTRNFSADMNFEEGLWKQWENRIAFARDYPVEVRCYEVLRHSPYGEQVLKSDTLLKFKAMMGKFFEKSIANKEMEALPLDVFWSVAYGPLYTLLRFHQEGKSMGGKPFVLTDTMIQQAFRAAIKALRP